MSIKKKFLIFLICFFAITYSVSSYAFAEDDGWVGFRNSAINMAISDAKTPTKKCKLLWNKKGDGYTNAYSEPIIIDNSLVVMKGNTINKLDINTGEVILSSEMLAAPSYGNTPPTYGGGMIFCPLSDGRIQAFYADTLESAWIYQDELGGQALSPITYSEGKIYTGFWNSETEDASFVCVDVSDESPEEATEPKDKLWSQVHTGGFYWAGARAIGNHIIVGSDDGTTGFNGSPILYSFDKLTGEIKSQISLEGIGDIRSSIIYSGERIYFTSKGGYLCSANINGDSGEIEDVKTRNYNTQITSTPIFYQGRVYFGSANLPKSKNIGNFICADAETLKKIYSIGVSGYPQGSMLLSTGNEDGLYFYTTYNKLPGGLSIIKTKSDATTKKEVTVIEGYDAKDYEGFCISSPICSNDGIIVYKNDSGSLFALVEDEDADEEKEQEEAKQKDKNKEEKNEETIVNNIETVVDIPEIESTPINRIEKASEQKAEESKENQEDIVEDTEIIEKKIEEPIEEQKNEEIKSEEVIKEDADKSFVKVWVVVLCSAVVGLVITILLKRRIK